MKFPFARALLFSLLINACATQAPSPSVAANAEAGRHQHGMGDKSLCPDPATPPSLQCATAVSASFDPQGKLWLAWVDRQHVYVQTSVDKGQHISTPVQVNSEAENIAEHGEYRPKIQADGQGHVYLTWTQNLEKRYAGHIRFSRSSDGGESFSPPVTVNDNLDQIGHRFDGLALGEHGEIFIAWLDARDKEQAKTEHRQFEGASLYYTWSDNAGQSFYPNKLAAPHSCECCRLAIEIEQGNLPVILWRQVFEGGIRDHALLKFSDWSTPGSVMRASNENWKIDACPHHGPALSVAAEVYHAAWFSAAPQNSGLFYGNSRDRGQTFSPPIKFGGQGAGHPSVLALGQQVALLWSEYDGEHNLLKLMRSSDQGQNWSAPQTFGSSSGSADYGFLLSDGERLYVSWQSEAGYQFKVLD